MSTLLALSPTLLLLGIALLVLLIIVLMLVLLWRSKRKQEEAEAQQTQQAQAAETTKQPKNALPEKSAEIETRLSVSSALRFLEQNSIGRGLRYRSPWFLVLGASDSGKSTLLENPGISLSLREGSADFGVSHGIKWRFFDAGVILDVPGHFFIGAEQTTSDERKWKGLLRNLVRYRPQRPIDGVVLAIPATELVGDTAVSPAVIGQRATHIFNKLWQLQKWTGLCFPVYVVITKCDLVPGFKAMARQLPSQYKNQMFGWSNPYNLETAFDSCWVDQGFEELSYDLGRLESEIFTECNDIPDVDSLFLFSSKLQELRRPLRIYLNQIFKNSAYRESLQFRGFYFMGDASDEHEAPKPVRALAASAAAGSGSPYSLLAPSTFTSTAPGEEVITEEVTGVSSFATEQREHQPVFVADLFESKIFPERGIAHPASKTYLSKNRTVVALQIACVVTTVVLTIGVWIGYRRLSETQRITLPMLDRIMASVRESRSSEPGYVSEQDKDTAFILIDAMERLTGRGYRALFFPTSLTGSMDERVKQAMVPAFERLVYATFRQELLDKKDRLLKEIIKGRDDDSTSSSSLPLTSVQHTKGYSRSLELTTRLLDLELNIERYNELATPGKGNPRDLIFLESYLRGRQLPSNFDYEKNIYFREALRLGSGERIELTPSDIQQASAKMRRETERLFVEWMANSTIIPYLHGLKDKIDALDRQELQTFEQLTDLKNSIAQAQALFSSSDLLWLANRKLAQFGPINDVTKVAIERSAFLGPKQQLADYVDRMADENYAVMQAKIRNERTGLTGPLLNLDNNLVKLSPEAVNIGVLLQKFLDLPFVKREGTEAIRTKLRPDERLSWNTDSLQEAISLQDSYNRFQQQELNDAPASLRNAFTELSLTHLEANMADLIARAQSFTTVTASSDVDENIASEVQNFQEASEPLSTLLGDLLHLELTETHQQLFQVTTRQAGNLLMRIDQRYEAQSPYAANVNNFERWTGENTPTRAGFEAHGPEEVAQYLAFQRQQVQQYAAKATPLVKFLDGRIASGGKEPGRSLLKWQRIVADLQKYAAKIPGTSLASLEDFIGADIDKASPENCQTASLTTASLPGGDYFVQTRESLRHGLLNRCRVLSEQNALRAYTHVAKLFNERLAGKFPFSTPPQEQMPNEADPQDIVELFRLLDTYGKPIHAGLRSGTFGSSYSSVQAFMGQLEGLRPLFTPLMAADSDPIPIFDFVPIFRVNQGREVNGNQIIEWTLQVGADTFHYHDPQRAGRWSYGEPVKLTLRWAKDSPQQPLLGSAVADSKAGTRTVTFEYHDNWALFRMLKLHEPPSNDFDRMADPEPQTLVFTVNDNKSSDPAARSTGNTSPQAKVFVRIKLRPPGKPENLRVRIFPIEAPALEQVQAQSQRDSVGGDNQ
ncbi:MAG TPA: type VI secretion system protein [Candidatus Angelobacter sp.]|nr:type VI secretion system protein [Candidatus Angelobacter sp.]